ncbi:MAG TPA: nodulation protein NfeD [Nevskiaceae bacterium]
MKGMLGRVRAFALALVAGAVLACIPTLLAAQPGDAPTTAGEAGGFVARISFDGAIGPATAEYYRDASRRAIRDGARAILLEIDTPGGLSSAMHEIIAGILASPIPVIGYVAPAGARAASAGTYILYACHVAAMGPATHLGAATPVSLGGGKSPSAPPLPLPGSQERGAPASAASRAPPAGGEAESRKVLNDAAAYIRSLAELRHRNVAWAEDAVRGAATLTASQAAAKGVVDFVADNAQAALAGADGQKTTVDGRPEVIHGLANLPVHDYPMGARLGFLSVITNPTVAYGLLLAGVWGLMLEGFHPGAILPGTVGAIALLVALYALHLLPVNYAGLGLMVLGVGMIVAEVVMPTIGVIGLGGVVAFVIGSIMLFDTSAPGFGVNLGVIAGLAVFAAGFLFLVLGLLMRSRRRRPTIGAGDELVGVVGVLEEPIVAGGEAWAMVHGERWRVVCSTALPAKARVRVTSRDGLLLSVEPR